MFFGAPVANVRQKCPANPRLAPPRICCKRRSKGFPPPRRRPNAGSARRRRRRFADDGGGYGAGNLRRRPRGKGIGEPDGQRTIAGDDSTGEDLYYFECAPRFNTVNNDYWYYCGVATDSDYPFSGQVQNGGSCLWISYYDILARFMVLGAENAYERLSEIMEWYQDVTDAYTQAQTSGATSSATEFYRAYYYDIANCSSSSYDVYNETYNAKHISLQGQVNGKDSAGALGLDSEFLEIFQKQIWKKKLI